MTSMSMTRTLKIPTPANLGYSFNWVGRIGLAVMIFWAVIALIGPWITPFPPGEVVEEGAERRHEGSPGRRRRGLVRSGRRS